MRKIIFVSVILLFVGWILGVVVLPKFWLTGQNVCFTRDCVLKAAACEMHLNWGSFDLERGGFIEITDKYRNRKRLGLVTDETVSFNNLIDWRQHNWQVLWTDGTISKHTYTLSGRRNYPSKLDAPPVIIPNYQTIVEFFGSLDACASGSVIGRSHHHRPDFVSEFSVNLPEIRSY